jgi:hypothetical protein
MKEPRSIVRNPGSCCDWNWMTTLQKLFRAPHTVMGGVIRTSLSSSQVVSCQRVTARRHARTTDAKHARRCAKRFLSPRDRLLPRLPNTYEFPSPSTRDVFQSTTTSYTKASPECQAVTHYHVMIYNDTARSVPARENREGGPLPASQTTHSVVAGRCLVKAGHP